MTKFSLCMIVKNEEQTIGRCLDTVKNLVDEIIIVDTGSTDNTKKVLKNFNCKIFDFTWCDDFSKARNFSFSMATGDYILWLDADDIVPIKTLNYIKKLKENMTADVYMLKYDIAFHENKSTFSYYRERIIKNCPLAIWYGAVHECITPFGKIERLNYSIEHRKIKPHDCNRNLKIYRKIVKTRQLSPREQYYYGRELFDHKKYKDCIRILNKFVKSNLGWSENVIDALYLISICYSHLEKPEKEFESLTKTFLYDTPRANICCKIGDIFINQKNYKSAIYWYMQAINCKDVSNKGGFIEKKYYNYYPYLQLCVCYYYLGDIKLSYFYNEKASKFNNNTIVQNNRKLLQSLL